jgi:hypothetical protein
VQAWQSNGSQVPPVPAQIGHMANFRRDGEGASAVFPTPLILVIFMRMASTLSLTPEGIRLANETCRQIVWAFIESDTPISEELLRDGIPRRFILG